MAGLGKLVPSKNLPVSFFLSPAIQVSRSSPRTALPCRPNISFHPSTSRLRLKEQNLVTHSDSSQCANSNHRPFYKMPISWQRPTPTKTANPRSFLKSVFEGVLTRTESQA